MTRTSHPAAAGQQAQPQPWGRLDTVLFVLVATALAVALASLGALHALNGLVICALTGWLMSETSRRAVAKRSPE